MSMRKEYLYDSILFLVAIIIYAPSLMCGFVGDDLIYFIGNKFIKSFDIWTMLRSGAIGADYLPLRDISFAVDYLVWGEKPFGFHLTNLLLYGITIIVIRHLFLKWNYFLFNAENDSSHLPSFVAALLFALHPTHRDVVYAVHNRGALLTALFCSMSLLFTLNYMQGKSNKYRSYAIAFICFICALMSREYSIILPLTFVLMACFDERSKLTSHIIATIPFFMASTGFYFIFKQYAVAANYISYSSNEPFFAENISKVTVAAKIVVFYIIRMTTFMGKFSQADTAAYSIVSVLIVITTLMAVIIYRRRYPVISFGFLFYLLCLIPVLNFFKTDPVVAARYAYLPCIGLFFMFTAISSSNSNKYIHVLLIVFTSSWFFLTNQQSNYYKNNITYWENTIPYVKNATVFTQLGYAYYSDRQYAKAFETLTMAQPVPIDSKYFEILGNSCFEIGNYQCALRAYESLLNFDDSKGSALSNLAKVYTQLGDHSNALKYFELHRKYLSQANEKQ